MRIRCKNEYCPYNKEDVSVLDHVCGCPHDVQITETAECETYWYAAATGQARDLREVPLCENPRLTPMYERKEGHSA